LIDFGICRARKDGHNLYCKTCIRQKVSDSRKVLKAYKSLRDHYPGGKSVGETKGDQAGNDELPFGYPQNTSRPLRMTPAERVREAIRKGARTQKEIAQGTKLGKDEIGDALANLLLWTREIRTEVVGTTRRYLINEAALEPAFAEPDGEADVLPPRKRDVPSSFSALPDLMPGKKPQGEPEKPGSWVAA
jgi:hypothetical protein